MSKRWLTVRLALLLGTALSAAVPGARVLRAHGQDVIDDGNITEHRVQVEPARWGDQNGEQGEVEAPRWRDQGGEKSEREAPRWGDQGGEQGEIESTRS
jgi:hypothetical protein